MIEKQPVSRPNSKLRLTAVSAVVGVALILLAGCATSKTYTVNVEARSLPDRMMGRESYRLVTRNLDSDQSSLRTLEAEEQIRTALSGIGLYEAPIPEEADMVIEIDYGVSPPKEILREYEEPIFVTVPGRIEYVPRTVTRPDGSTVTILVPVPTGPEQVYAGTQRRVRPSTVYDKYLTITGVGINRDQGDEQRESIWTVNVTNQNESDDLREHIPIMVAAALNYIGTNTEKEERVRVRANDSDVTFIREGYTEEGPFAEPSPPVAGAEETTVTQ